MEEFMAVIAKKGVLMGSFLIVVCATFIYLSKNNDVKASDEPAQMVTGITCTVELQCKAIKTGADFVPAPKSATVSCNAYGYGASCERISNNGRGEFILCQDTQGTQRTCDCSTGCKPTAPAK
jgi:hypothetical protein